MVDILGDSLEYDFYVVDTTSSPMVGETPTLSDGYAPSGEVHGFHIEELGDGWYRVTGNPTTEVGGYRVLATFRSQGDPDYQQWALTWDVDPVSDTAYQTILLDRAGGTTLADLRRRVARSVRDYRLAEATDPGSTTTLTDIFNLTNNTDFYRGAELVCVSGAPSNIGKKRKVVASSFETSTVTFRPPLPQPTQVGDTFDIFRFARTPFMIAEYDQAINDAIASAFPANRERAVVIPTAAFDVDQGYIDIPDVLHGIYALHYESFYTDWASFIPMVNVNDPTYDGYYIDRGNQRISFGPNMTAMSGRHVAIYGYIQPPPLIRDDDRTKTDSEWIVEQAGGVLLQSNLDQATFAIGQAKSNRADQLRAKMANPPEPSTIWLE